MAANAVDQDIADAHDRVTNHIFGSGLTLASIVSSQRVDADIAQRLLDVIDELDRAVGEIRSAALAGARRENDARSEIAAVPATVSILASWSPRASVTVLDGRRQLCRVGDDEVFAYAQQGHDFFRASDQRLWAHESGDLLLSARSGTPFARRTGNVFHDLASRVPLYYESLTHPIESRPVLKTVADAQPLAIQPLPMTMKVDE